MHYVNDDSEIRDKKDAVEDAKDEIRKQAIQDEIDALQKQIDLLDEQKEGIQEQIDALKDYREEVEKFYEDQIAATEKFYDEQIKALEKQKEALEDYYKTLTDALEKQKTKFEELKELQEEAQQQALFERYGIDAEALLSGSEEEFDKLKNMYNTISDELNSLNDISDETVAALSQLGIEVQKGVTPAVDGVKDLSTAFEGLEASSTNSSKNLTDVSDSTAKISETATPAATGLEGVSTAASGLSNIDLSKVTSDFSTLTEKATELRNALNGEGGSSIDTVFSTLATLSLQTVVDNVTELVAQITNLGNNLENLNLVVSAFQTLQSSISMAASAIDGAMGGSGMGGNGDPLAGGSSASSTTSSLTSSLDALKSKADEVLGTGGGEGGGDSEGTGVIGQFDTLKSSVDSVSSAIGGGEGSEGGEGETLVDSITTLGDTATEVVGSTDEEETINGRFQAMSDVIAKAEEHVTGISDGLAAIDDQTVECTIKVNIETSGGVGMIGGLVDGTALITEGMNLNSAEYNARYGSAHLEGTANVRGNWGVHQGGRSLVGELGQETVVRDGKFFTVGDNGAEMVDLQKGDIVFNHKQTEELFKYGKISSRGHAFANGSTGSSYADGSPIKSAISFAGGSRSIADIESMASKLANTLGIINPAMQTFGNVLDATVGKMTNLINKNTTTNNTTNVSIGDIHVHEVENANDFAKVVIQQFPNAMLQELHRI